VPLDLADQYCNPYNRSTDDIVEEDTDEEDEDEDEEGSEEEESEEESGEEGKPELTRQERRDLKKKAAAAKEKKNEEGDEEEDPDLINPNHVQKKLNISDLNSPRELTRRERCVFSL
jgi:cobalamin biosynthesis protein CobT